MERLQKVIANMGYTSRRNAEELIIKGKVEVNGEIITKLGTKVSEKDEIVVEGVLLSKENRVYYILNKPRGYITTTKDDKNRNIVTDLINTDIRIYPVGRLDYDTTGLLLLTNDGDFANMLMHPKNKIEKTYVAKVKGIVDGYSIKQLRDGVMIDGVKTSKAKVKLKDSDYKTKTSIVELVIHEGKNHQIKKMFEAVGFEVIKLKREKYAFLNLKGLQSGESRMLTGKEVSKLYELINK